MFECRTCLRRVWGALLNDLNPRSTSQRSVTHNAARQWQRVEPRRWQSTASVRSPTQDSRRLGPSKSTRMTTHEGRLRQPVKDVRSPGSFKRSLRGDLLDQRGAMVVKNQRTESKEDEVDNTALEQSDSQRDVLTSVEKRKMINAMKFLTDPKKFADHINDLLYKRQNVEAALKFVRFASKSTKCVVAWNHVIRWHLANKKPNAALKLYNEMKKRDQWPDSYTYMVLIRGLTDYWQHSSMLSKALSIYHSMSASNSRVQPQTVHTNMALKICARAADMDALWGVASRLPDKGPKSADSITYCIILNAIRRQALEEMDPEDSNIAAVVQHFDKAVLLGCRMWADVTAKWRNGDLKMDDALVCAMGRLLLLSYRPDAWDAIFSLVQGTEGVPRMSTPADKLDFSKHLPAPTSSQGETSTNENGIEVLPSAESIETAESDNQFGQFLSLVNADSRMGDAMDRANSNLIQTGPTNNTLSLLLETCRKLANKKAGDAYWELLVKVDQFDIEPDNDNFHSYLRLLRQHRSSAQALGLIINEMKSKHMSHKTFRIALSTCQRDTGNPFAFGYSKSVINLMMRHPGEPHIGTLLGYLQFAMSSKDVGTVVKAMKHMDEILHGDDQRVLPRTVEGVQRLPAERTHELRRLVQYLLDSLAWAEGQPGFVAHSDKQWPALHGRIVRSSNLFGRAGLKPEPVEKADPPITVRNTAAVDVRYVRRLLKSDPAPATAPIDEDDMAELPFEMGTEATYARI